jgi:tRNA-uridine 2-sulfurtransferase
MKTVYVGLSGGVDSSVTAALLKQQGYRVVGVYMQNWTDDIAGAECPWKQDLADAHVTAARLDIPFKVFDFQVEYKQKVVEAMINEFKLGRTPNPDVLCNQDIKFKLFLDTALADGADLIATGHYARVSNARLFKGLDDWKDQSYFLYRMTSSALDRALMPIGELHKPDVRHLAAELKLPTAAKPDSQGFSKAVPARKSRLHYPGRHRARSWPARWGLFLHTGAAPGIGSRWRQAFLCRWQRHGPQYYLCQ